MKGRLQLLGGRPVRSTLLPYGRQSLDEADIKAVSDVLRSDWLTTGPKVAEFEAAFAKKVHAKHAVAFSSGTAALHGAAFAAGLGPGDEAVTTPMTFAATANCVLYMGARPVFADVTPDTLNLDPDKAAKALTPETKAVLPVDFAGHPADIHDFLRLAEERGLVIIEDAAHALGARLSGQPIGGLAHMSVFSFHPVKHITTGEGGMVTTNDPEVVERLAAFRSHGIRSDARDRQAKGQWFYEMQDLGYNYRLSDLGAALGLSQLKKLDAFVSRRRAIARRYNDAFSHFPQLVTPAERDGADHAWHLYTLRFRLDRVKASREQLFRALRGENIGVNVHYIPVHYHPFYQKRGIGRKGAFPIAEAAFEAILSLPIFPAMGEQDTSDVIDAVEKVITHYAR